MADLNLTQVLTMPWAIPVIMGCLVAIVAIVSTIVSGCITEVAETKLKRSMVERGFSPIEIERVVKASADDSVSCKPFPTPKHYPAKV